MKKFAKLTAFATITVLLVSVVAFAQSAGPDKSGFVAPVGKDVPESLTNTVIKKTYLSSAAPFLSVPASTFTVLDPGGTINCPGTTKCTPVVDAWATSANSVGGNRALCTVVDNNIAGFCGYDGNDATTGEFSAFTALDGKITIGPGNHSAFMYVFSNGGATVAFYSIRYRVYKP